MDPAIEIKTLFMDWKLVDRETAKRYISTLRNGLTGIPESEKNRHINEHSLRGITVEELFGKS